MKTPNRQIRAVYTEETIRVYQAYNDQIADNALVAGTFVEPFSFARMTWIKPSFLWMMYRSGWGHKDEGQRRILALDLRRSGFEWALRNATLTHGPKLDKTKLVRVQWDPERSIHLERLEHRSIQIGLSAPVVERYVKEWIVGVTDVTPLAREIHARRDPARLPAERPYPLDADLQAILGIESAPET